MFLYRGLLAFLFSLLIVFSLAEPVLAISDPDSMAIKEVAVFRDIKTTGDQLYFVRYDISYASEPVEDASAAFQMIIYDSGGTVVLFSRDLNYYQHNIISIYLTPTQALTWDSNYKIRVQGKIGIFAILTEDINMDTWALNSSDYHEQTAFEAYIISQAETLEDDWGLTLLDSYNRLNTTGAMAFSDAIPGLVTYYPDLYVTSTSIPSVTWTNWTKAYVNSLGSHKGTKLDALMDALGSFMGIEGKWMAFWLVLMGGFVLGSIVYAFSGSSASALTFTFMVLPLATWMGLEVALFNLMATILIILAIGFGIVFILARFA